NVVTTRIGSPRPKVIIIQRDPVAAEVMAERLTAWNFRTECYPPSILLEPPEDKALDEDEPKFVIVDHLPQMNLTEEQIESRWHASFLRIIWMTELGREDGDEIITSRENSPSKGRKHRWCFMKPVNYSELWDVICRATQASPLHKRSVSS